MKKKDLLLLLGAFALAGVFFLISQFSNMGKTSLGTVRIYLDGQFYAEEKLVKGKEIRISQPTGEINILTCTENGFFMQHSSCQNQLCVQQGEVNADNYYLRSLGNRIICLPNRVEAELLLSNQTLSPDMPDI